MVAPEQFGPEFELPEDEGFDDYCLRKFRQIRQETHRFIPGWNYNHPSALYDKEIDSLREIFRECATYMNDEDIALVKRSARLALFAHADHYRDTGDPYTAHLFTIVSRLARKHQDAIIIASGFNHDDIEDTRHNPHVRVTEETLSRHIHPEVSSTVQGLSEYRGDITKPKLTDEEKRLQVLQSLSSNPRVAIIKIHDRLQNLETLAVKKRSSRINTIEETKRLYIPLARLLGLTEEATLMEEQCILQDDRENRELFKVLQKRHEKLEKSFNEEVVLGSVRSDLGNDLFLKARLGSTVAMYHDAKNREHINIDIAVPGVMKNKDVSWGRDIRDVARRFIYLQDKYTIGDDWVHEKDFIQQIEAGLTDSLHFTVIRKRDGAKLQIHIYPQDVYELEQVPITDLYVKNFRDPQSVDNIPVSDELVQLKQRQIATRLEEVLRAMGEGQQIPEQIIGRLAPRISEYMMYVTGKNKPGDTGEMLPWQVPIGSSVLDYAKNIALTTWQRIVSAEVSGQPNTPYDYILKPGDIIYIEFDKKKKSHYEASWIHSFRTDPDGADVVRKKIEGRLRSSKLNKENLFYRVRDVGKLQCDATLPEAELPFLYGLSSDIMQDVLKEAVKEVVVYLRENDIYQYLPQLNEDSSTDDRVTLFLFAAGLGIIPQQTIETIMSQASEINKKVRVVELQFHHNDKGQASIASAVATKMSINLVGDHSEGEGSSTVKLYIRPEDEQLLPELLKNLANSKGLAQRQLDSIYIYFLSDRARPHTLIIGPEQND